MSYNRFQSRTMSEIILAFHVSSGFLLITIAPLISIESLLDTITGHWPELIVRLICSIFVGVITYFVRKRIQKFKRALLDDSNLITIVDLITIIYTGSVVVLGLIIIQLGPPFNLLYAVFLIIMVAVVGLNIYFSCFWQMTVPSPSTDFGLESLKLEHQEWSTIFNNLVITCLVIAGGMTLTHYTQLVPSSSEGSAFYTVRYT